MLRRQLRSKRKWRLSIERISAYEKIRLAKKIRRMKREQGMTTATLHPSYLSTMIANWALQEVTVDSDHTMKRMIRQKF